MPGWWKKSPDSLRGNKSVNFSLGVWHFASKYTFCGTTVAWHWMRKCREAGQGGWQMWGRGKNLKTGDDSSRNSSRRNMANIYSVAKHLIIKTLLGLLVIIQWSKTEMCITFFSSVGMYLYFYLDWYFKDRVTEYIMHVRLTVRWTVSIQTHPGTQLRMNTHPCNTFKYLYHVC